jgi:hypothetical protein
MSTFRHKNPSAKLRAILGGLRLFLGFSRRLKLLTCLMLGSGTVGAGLDHASAQFIGFNFTTNSTWVGLYDNGESASSLAPTSVAGFVPQAYWNNVGYKASVNPGVVTTNATLNTSSGAFSFRPLVTQANTSNNFTLQVSDNGTPSLSATQGFAVVVNPLSAPAVSSVSVAGGQFSFSVSGQSGPDYAIESSTNLVQWSNVFITNSPALPFNWTATADQRSAAFLSHQTRPAAAVSG